MANTNIARSPWPRLIIGVLLLAGVWYGCILLLPSIRNGSPALPIVVQTSLRVHYKMCHMGKERFGDLSSPALKNIQTYTTRTHNGYRLKVFTEPNGNPQAIVAYPQRVFDYKHTFVDRVLFLNFSKHRFPSILLRNDGLICRSDGFTGFCDDNPPTERDLVIQDNRWVACVSCLDLFRHSQTQPTTSTAPAGSRCSSDEP